VRYILQGNRIHDNGGCGIFYCLRTTHSLCRDNRIENNAGTGISIGERDTDHAITGNTIRGQGGAGISFRPPTRCSGDRVVLKNNALHENCRLAGTAEIEIEDNLHWIHLEGNTITPAGKPAIHVGDHCSDIYIGNQSVSGRPLQPSDVAGSLDAVQFKAPLAFPAVGPDALPASGALHLGVANPGQCRRTPL
jgi:hypothetical protein